MMQSLQKELKKARLFEVQRISKRIKALERKRGNELQLQKNQRKASKLKQELDLIKRINLPELADHISEITDSEQHLDVNPPTDLNERAKWRVLSSKTIQKFISTTNIRTSDTRTVIVRTNTHNGSAMVTESLSVPPAESDNDTDNDDDVSDTSLEEDETVEEDTKPLQTQTQRHSSERTIDSIFVSSLSVASSKPGTTAKRAPSENGSHKTKKNRLGQRARRRLWLSKFGDKATHLKQKVKLQRVRGESRIPKRATVQLSSSTKRTSMAATTTALHPSWQASRTKKQQESGIGQFQGKKTVFTDSDSD